MARRRRRYYRRRSKKASPEEIFALILIVVVIVVLYQVYEFVSENLAATAWTVVGILALAGILSVWKRQQAKRQIQNLPTKVAEVKVLFDAFATDIPKYSRHQETVYQVDFGRYLKDHLPNDEVVYEFEKGQTRIDILINKTLAIEVKALKNPITKENRGYNKDHVNSIFKKVFTYKAKYPEVIVALFNTDGVRNAKWEDYEQMKKAAQQQGVHVFEK